MDDAIEQAFFSDEGAKSIAGRLHVSLRTLRARWVAKFGADAYQQRTKSVRAKSAARVGLQQRRPASATKPCSQCKKQKPLHKFVRNAKRHDGRSSWCLACSRSYQAQRSPKYKYHDKARERREEWRRWLDGVKDHPCTDCGLKFPPVVMDFDHVRGDKVASIGSMVNWRRDQVIAELAKCELVCANCHRIRTHLRQNG